MKANYNDFTGPQTAAKTEFLQRKTAQTLGINLTDSTGRQVSNDIVTAGLRKRGFDPNQFTDLRAFLIKNRQMTSGVSGGGGLLPHPRHPHGTAGLQLHGRALRQICGHAATRPRHHRALHRSHWRQAEHDGAGAGHSLAGGDHQGQRGHHDQRGCLYQYCVTREGRLRRRRLHHCHSNAGADITALYCRRNEPRRRPLIA